MRIGQLDRRVTIEQATETQNSNGEPVKTWATLASVWAHVAEIRGSEAHESDQVAAKRETKFRLRCRSDVTEKMRILYSGHYYDIQAVHELGRRDGLEVIATAAVP